MEDHCHSFFDRLIRPMVGAHALFSLLLKIFLRFVAASVLGVRVDGPNNTQVIQMWWWARKQWLSNRKTVNIVHHDIFFARCRMYWSMLLLCPSEYPSAYFFKPKASVGKTDWAHWLFRALLNLTDKLPEIRRLNDFLHTLVMWWTNNEPQNHPKQVLEIIPQMVGLWHRIYHINHI